MQLKRITLNLEDITADLLCLMAACNDTTVATRHMLETMQPAPAEAEEIKLAGERLYWFRVVYGHLYEGLRAYTKFKSHAGINEIFRDAPDEVRQHIDVLEATIGPNGGIAGSFYEKLATFRNDTSFHYKKDDFKKALFEVCKIDKNQPIVDDGVFINIRYVVADNVIAEIFGSKHLGVVEEMTKSAQEICSVQTALVNFTYWYTMNFMPVV